MLVALVLLAAVAGSTRASRARAPASDCAGCHAEIASAWSASRHARAYDNPTFRESFRRSGQPWCLSCHAATSRSDGVACAACHEGPGGLVSASAGLLARIYHPIEAEEGFASERLCARCHQFDFPTPSSLRDSHQMPLSFTDTPSQDTVEEWRQSTAAAEGRSCTHCHDPHEAPGARDHALLRGTLSARVDYDPAAGLVKATISAKGAAHAVPTGDPFRRLHLTICGPERCELPYAERLFQRRPREEGDDFVVSHDNRIGPARSGDVAEIEASIQVPELPPGSRWRLHYRYADPLHESALPSEEVRSLVAEGVLVEGDREPK